MIALRVAIVGLAAFAGALVWLIRAATPTWLDALTLTMVFVAVLVALFYRRALRGEPLIDGKWEPAPPDLDAIAGHAAALNPVPAVAPAPVDELLATLPAAPTTVAELRAIVPAVAMLDGPEVDTDQLELADRVRVLEQATITLMARFDSYGTEQAQMMSRLLTSHREQTDKALTRFAEQLQAALPKPETPSDE